MNRFRTIVMYFWLAAVSLVLLGGIRFAESRLDDLIAGNKLRFTGQIKNAPPMVIFTTVGLGSFRGLVADLLWLRAGTLKNKGSYFEQAQLARWITDLQPTFSGATAYLAWNMAYNISVTCSTPAERWRWVSEGIRLLRDQALVYNPEDWVLYKELAWIYQHKLGNVLDEGNLYYKIQLALQMTEVVGSNPDWPALAAAPVGEKEFMAAYPPESPVWAAAKAAGYPDYESLYRAFSMSSPAQLPEAFLAGLRRNDKLKKDLLTYFRAELLRQRLKLDPKIIDEINRKYGNLDWRVPESLAIYWATRGKTYAPDRTDTYAMLDREITQSLYESFKAGRILMLDEKNFESLITVPNLSLIDAVYQAYVDAQIHHDGEGVKESSFHTARMNFLKEAIAILFNYGSFSKAEKYFNILVRDDGPQKHGRTLEEFVMGEFAEEVHSANVKQANEIISGLIFRSIHFMLYNDLDAALANERIARYIYSKYAAGQGASERQRLRPYNEIKRVVTEQCLKTFPPGLAAILRARIAAEQAAETEQQKQPGPAGSLPSPAPAAGSGKQ